MKKLKNDSKINLSANNNFESIDNDIINVVSILNKIAKDYPIIFIVDELDRCIPNFAIKTLERLHHIFGKVKNSVTILAFNREQINRSIDHAYGEGSAEGYLKKFINFRVILNSGSANESEVKTALNEFSKLFQPCEKIDPEYSKLIDSYCENFTPREFENMLSRAILCHNLVGEDTSTYPIECMVAEIILQAVLTINELERSINNVSPDNGNSTQTAIGREQKNYFINLKRSFIPQIHGKGIIAYILNLVLGYSYPFHDSEQNSEFGRKIRTYYSRYRTYYFMIKTP